jgi:hypothetical protein
LYRVLDVSGETPVDPEDPVDPPPAGEPIEAEFTFGDPGSGEGMLRWTSVAGRSYQVQMSTELMGGSWENVGAVVVATTARSEAVVTLGGEGFRWYRVVDVTGDDPEDPELPGDPAPVELGLVVSAGGAGLTLIFEGEEGRTYQVQSSPDLLVWTDVGSPIVHGIGSGSIEIPASSGPPLFFRVRIVD